MQEASPQSAAADERTSPLTVVATFSILGDITANIGGDRIDLHVLVGPDRDGHLYQPTPRDSRLLRRADLVISNGLGFEGWIDRLIQAAEYRGETVVASTGITLVFSDDGRAREPDPHAWQSIANVKHYVRNIAFALQRLSPENREYFSRREAEYLTELEHLERELSTALAGLPSRSRTIVTSHDAFHYFGRAYHLNFLAPVGLNTDSEASAGDVARLIRQINDEGIRGVFVENITDPRLLQRIASETNADIGGVLYSDALSPPDGPAATYIAMMKHNLRTLMTALNTHQEEAPDD